MRTFLGKNAFRYVSKASCGCGCVLRLTARERSDVDHQRGRPLFATSGVAVEVWDYNRCPSLPPSLLALDGNVRVLWLRRTGAERTRSTRSRGAATLR